jgi:amino-acid N-acetyltransferase
MSIQAHYRPATNTDLRQIKDFLSENQLPDSGVDAWLDNFIIAEDEKSALIGVAGFELHDKTALLRSVAVDKNFRGHGNGRILVEIIVKNAEVRGAKTVYLLTDNASAYFERLGFEIVSRDNVDESVKTSVEFTALCRDATVMRKVLN